MRGWTLGGGIEHNFGNGWSIKGEYLFTRFDDAVLQSYRLENQAFVSINQIISFASGKHDVEVLRVGLKL